MRPSIILHHQKYFYPESEEINFQKLSICVIAERCVDIMLKVHRGQPAHP